MNFRQRLTAGMNLNPICYIVGHQKRGVPEYCYRSYCWKNWNVRIFNEFRR